MDLEWETPVCLETPSSEGTQTEAWWLPCGAGADARARKDGA